MGRSYLLRNQPLVSWQLRISFLLGLARCAIQGDFNQNHHTHGAILPKPPRQVLGQLLALAFTPIPRLPCFRNWASYTNISNSFFLWSPQLRFLGTPGDMTAHVQGSSLSVGSVSNHKLPFSRWGKWASEGRLLHVRASKGWTIPWLWNQLNYVQWVKDNWKEH